MGENKQYQEIDILKLLNSILKRWWIVVLVAILGAGIAFGYTKFFVTPQYESQAMMYVNNTSSIGGTKIQLSSSDLSASKSLVDTYTVILKSRLTLEEVIDKAGVEGKYSYEQLKKMVRAASVDNTEVFSITVTSPDPKEACRIANTIVDVLPKAISDIVEGSTVKTVDYAVISSKPVSPSVSKNTIIGFVIGFVVACGAIVLGYFLNDTLDTEDWLTETFGDELPILAIIPDSFSESKNNKGYYKKHYYNNKYYSRNYYSSGSSTKDKSVS